MKRCFFLIFGLLSISLSEAQVGVNTKAPQGAFHIDPKSDTLGSSATNDDVIVTTAGWLGLGTVAPDAALHIKTAGTATTPISGFRLEDGNQGIGKSLAAISSTGLATWVNLTPTGAALFVAPGGSPNVPVNTSNYYNSGSYIDLGSGRWLVQIISLINIAGTTIDTPIWVSSTLADATTVVNNGQVFANIVTPDIEGTGGRVAGLCWTTIFTTITGTLVINNNTATTKRYYYMTGETSTYGVSVSGAYVNIPGDAWGETKIIGFKIPSDL